MTAFGLPNSSNGSRKADHDAMAPLVDKRLTYW